MSSARAGSATEQHARNRRVREQTLTEAMRRIARRVRLASGAARSRTRRAPRRAAAAPRRRREAAGGARRGVRARECVDHRVVLLRKHRAGDIQQFTTRPKHLPKRIEDVRLARGERGEVVAAAQPLDVGMAPRDAGGRAGHVGEDAIEGHAVPPVVRPGCNPRARRARRGRAAPGCARAARSALRRPPARSARPPRVSRMCAALPPGAAQASSTRWPAASSRQRAARCAPASCTETSPAANPGRRSTGTGRSSSRASSPMSRAAMPSAASGSILRHARAAPFTRRHIGGCELPAARIASQSSG